LGNLSLLTNFQKHITGSNTVLQPTFLLKDAVLVPHSTVIKITYRRGGQLIWLNGHFVKVAFS